MADPREGLGRDKQDRGLFASARKLARAAVTRAIERLTGMPLSGDPWATRGLLDVPPGDGAEAAHAPPPAMPVPAPRATTPPPIAAVATPAPTPPRVTPAPTPPAPPAPAAAPAASVRSAAPVTPIAPAAATTVKVAAPPVVPVAPARAGTVPGIGPTPPQPAAAPALTATPLAAPTRPAPPPPPKPTPIVMTPRAASAPRPSTGGLPLPAPGRPAPAASPTNGANGANGANSTNGTNGAASIQSPMPAPTQSPNEEAEQEPLGILDFEETPETYGIDEVAVIARDPRTLFAYWEVTPGAWDRARAALGGSGDGVLTLRLFVTTSDGHGGTHDFTHDTRLTWDHGRRYLDAPARAARISVAVGLLAHDGRFVAMAFGPPTLVPSGAVSPDAAEEWMDVAPAGPPGSARVPPRIRAVGSAAEVAAQMAASSRAARRAAAQRAGAASAEGGRKGRLLPSGAFELDEDATGSSWPTSRSRAAGDTPGEDSFWPGGSSPGGSSFGGSSFGGSSFGGSSFGGSSTPSPVTPPGKVQR